jgi:hypothetical protein
MSFNLASITNETRLRAPRIILLGVEKIGKSTFASQSDRPIFIPIKGEEGIDSIAVPQFPTCQSIDDVIGCLASLYVEDHNFGTMVIDSSTALEPIIWEKVCLDHHASDINSDGLGYARGYREATNYWRKITEALDYLRNEKGMASIIIGHVKVKRFDDPAGPSYDQYQFDLNDMAAGLLYKWADVILFANTKVIVKTEKLGFNKEKHQGLDIAGGQRFLYTQKNPAYPAGGRGVYGRLPPELSLNWNNFMNAVAATSKQQ